MSLRTSRSLALLALAATAVVALPAPSAAQMPDPRQMSGIPLPVSDLPAGTVSVRVVREAVTNIVPDQPVELVVGGETRQARTAATGRAEFTGLTPGTRVKAVATVDGERLESQEFAVPGTGGVRLMLVAGVGAGTGGASGPSGATAPQAAAPPSGPARTGPVTLGDQSRFVFELGDQTLTGFYILQFVNTGTTPVQPPQPIVVQLPAGAEQPTPLQGSSPQAVVSNTAITVNGPFAPGQTVVQVAFSLRYTGASVRVEQPLPVDLAQFTTLIEKVGEMSFTSPQMSQHREVTAQNDHYVVGQGPGVSAGTPLVFEFAGLPHAPTWPRNVALGLALAILAAGIVAALRRGPDAHEGRRSALEQKRDRLFGELAAVERRLREAGTPGDRDVARRRELVAALERIYAQLDDEAVA